MIHLSYFSSTGNTAYLAHKLKEILDLEDTQISRFGQEIPKNCSHLILMFPIHGFNPVRPVKKNIEKMVNSADKISLIAVGCNTSWVNDGASLPLKKKIKDKLALDIVLAMPLSFVVAFPEALARKNIEDSLSVLETVKEQLEKEDYPKRQVSIQSKLVQKLGSLESHAARLFGLELHATKACNACGHCWKNCPYDNIHPKKSKPSFGLSCGLCMKCIYECPQKAIKPYVSRFLPIKDGYRLDDYLEENK